MAALSDLISQTYKSTFNEVSSLLRVLVKYGFKDTAKKIQDKTMKLDAEIKEKESVIWNPKWMDTLGMAIPVLEFSRVGYKIKKVFG